MIHGGDMISTMEDVQYIGGYYKFIGGLMIYAGESVENHRFFPSFFRTQ